VAGLATDTRGYAIREGGFRDCPAENYALASLIR
jgi:hypothetical protein